MLVLGFALPAAQASGAPPSTSGVAQTMAETLAKVCRPAIEQNLAPRDLAESQGFRIDAPPLEVRSAFPATQLGSISLVKQVGGATIRVTSTVLLPPATIYSCLITSDAAPVDLAASVRAVAEPGGYAVMHELDGAAPSGSETVVWNARRPAAVDKITVVRRPGAPLASVILSYRVDAGSLQAAQGLAQLCKAGKAPRPEITCAQGGPN